MMRPATMDDATDWQRWMDDPLCTHYFPPEMTTYENPAEVWLTRLLTRYEENRFGFHSLIEASTGKYVGQCGLLSQEVQGELYLEVGYSLLREHWGKGYASEAARWFRNYGFEHTDTESIISLIHPENEASQKVALRNGMQPWKPAVFHDTPVVIYRISRGHWGTLGQPAH